MPAKQLSPEQLEDARRLRSVFTQRKREDGLTQERLAAEIGWSQGAVYQYLHGKMPLNYEALLKFCECLQVSAREISPSMATSMAKAVPIHSDPNITEIERVMQDLGDFERQVVLRAARSVAEAYQTKQDNAPAKVD